MQGILYLSVFILLLGILNDYVPNIQSKPIHLSSFTGMIIIVIIYNIHICRLPFLLGLSHCCVTLSVCLCMKIIMHTQVYAMCTMKYAMCKLGIGCICLEHGGINGHTQECPDAETNF